VRDERGLYERLSLEGFQSGLSWLTILRKREGFRAAFEGFDPDRVAEFGERDIERLVADASIVRHRGKIEAAIANARATVAAPGLRAAPGALLELRPGRTLAARRPGRLARHGPRVDSSVQAVEAGRLPVCRPDDGLRGHAGLRRGQRPLGLLLGPGGRRNRTSTSVLTHQLDLS